MGHSSAINPNGEQQITSEKAILANLHNPMTQNYPNPFNYADGINSAWMINVQNLPSASIENNANVTDEENTPTYPDREMWGGDTGLRRSSEVSMPNKAMIADDSEDNSLAKLAPFATPVGIYNVSGNSMFDGSGSGPMAVVDEENSRGDPHSVLQCENPNIMATGIANLTTTTASTCHA